MSIHGRLIEAFNALNLALLEAENSDLPQGLKTELTTQVERLESTIDDMPGLIMDAAMDEMWCQENRCGRLKTTVEHHPYGEGEAQELLCECEGRPDNCPAVQEYTDKGALRLSSTGQFEPMA